MKKLILLFLFSTAAFAIQTNDQARLVPHITPHTGGKVDGFAIEHLESGNDLAKTLLRQGDVIKSVDGEKVDTPQAAMRATDKIKSKHFKTVVILRDGKEQTFTH